MCVCFNYKRWGGCFRPSKVCKYSNRNTVIFDTRKSLYLKEPPAKLLKTYLKENEQ